MATTNESVIDWEAVARVTDADSIVSFLAPQRVIELLGVDTAIQTIGPERVLAHLAGTERFNELMASICSPEALENMARLAREREAEQKASE